jgi:LysM repeat protein
MKDVIGAESPISTFPVRRFSIAVDAAAVKKNNVVNPTDSIHNEVQIELPEGRNFLTLDQLAILNILAANNWNRPIYFTAPYGDLGFGQYLRKDGLTYRLVPAKNKFPQQKWVTDQALRGAIRDNNSNVIYQNLMNKFSSAGASKPGIYFDEENRRHLLSLRSLYAEAAGNLADENRKPEALKLLQKSEQLINTEDMPYAMASNYSRHNQAALTYLEAAYKAGDSVLVKKLTQAIRKDLTDQKNYYDYFKNEKEDFYPSIQREDEINSFLIRLLETLEKNYAAKQIPIQELPNTNRNAADTNRNR